MNCWALDDVANSNLTSHDGVRDDGVVTFARPNETYNVGAMPQLERRGRGSRDLIVPSGVVPQSLAFSADAVNRPFFGRRARFGSGCPSHWSR
jgi:hypothetical protein